MEKNISLYQPPAISPAKPVAPSASSLPFPTPFSDHTSDNKTEDFKMIEDEGEGKSTLNKVLDGKINKRKKNPKIKLDIIHGERKDFVNAKLRRMIYPKNPIKILEELGQRLNTKANYRLMEKFEEVVDGQSLTLFPCELDFNGVTFSGMGPDTEISQNLAAETAIQAFTVHVVNGEAPNPETSDPLDNAPWAALASLGLFKLFNDWQNKGFALPLSTAPGPMKQKQVIKGAPAESSSQDNFTIRPCKNIPEDPTSKHPVSLLNEIYPGTLFIASMHQPGIFHSSVTINDRNFVGTGRNKKDAKKFCAMAALKELMNIDYSNAG